ncbi:hypothetical protein EI94DRAFT_1786002 [Lactarius quietus]|nr:hypothetical protein EI94DRAFT_1786002 [Lactarius quietus]
MPLLAFASFVNGVSDTICAPSELGTSTSVESSGSVDIQFRRNASTPTPLDRRLHQTYDVEAVFSSCNRSTLIIAKAVEGIHRRTMKARTNNNIRRFEILEVVTFDSSEAPATPLGRSGLTRPVRRAPDDGWRWMAEHSVGFVREQRPAVSNGVFATERGTSFAQRGYQAPPVRVSTIRRRTEYIPNKRRPARSSSRIFLDRPPDTSRMSGLVLIATRASSGEWVTPCISGGDGWDYLDQCSSGSADGHATIVSAVARFPDTPGSAFEAQRELVAFVKTHKHLDDFRPPYRLTHGYCHPAGNSGIRASSRAVPDHPCLFSIPFISHQQSILNQPRHSHSTCKVLVSDYICYGTI